MAKTTKVPLPLIADPLNAEPAHPLCAKCGLFDKCAVPFIHRHVPAKWTGRILAVGDAPDSDDEELQRPLTGARGNELYRAIEAAGLSRDDVAVVFVNRCGSPETIKMNRIRLCRPFLLHDIQTLSPKWVIAFGKNAMKGVMNEEFNITDVRQRTFAVPGLPDSTVQVTGTYDLAEAVGKKGREIRGKIVDDIVWTLRFTGYRENPADTWLDPNVPAIGFDTEFTERAKLITVGLGWGDKAQAYEPSPPGFAPNNRVYAVGHNVFDDIAIAHCHGIKVPSGWIDGSRVIDTVTLARLDNENLTAYGLETLAVDRCNIKPWKKATEDIGYNCLEWPQEQRMERCRIDAWASSELARLLLPKLDKKLVSFYHTLSATLSRIEMSGVHVKRDTFNKIRKIICKELGTRSLSLLQVAREAGFTDRFEFTNDNHMRVLLYDILKQDVVRKTGKAGLPSVDKPSLTILFQQIEEGLPKEVIRRRLKYEKVEKLCSTYVVGVQDRLTPNDFLFPSINPLGARTGRRSSSDPNLQNWPKKMRQMIVSRWPEGRLVVGDESQLEPRIMALHAQIPQWLEIFEKGKNLYLESAKLLWKKDVEKDTPLYRLTKSTILGTNYGMEVDLFLEKLSTEQGVRLSRSDGEYVLQLYHKTFPQLPRFFNLQKERLIAHGYVENSAGQRRRLPCPDGERTYLFKHLWNEAVNFPIQSDAALITGSALIDTEAALLAEAGVTLDYHYDKIANWWIEEKKGLHSYEKSSIMELWDEYRVPLLINEVHDELVIDAPDAKTAKRSMEILKENMECVPTLRKLWPHMQVKLVAEPEIQLQWGRKYQSPQ